MTERSTVVPAAPEPLESQIAQLRRWIEGYIDDKGERHPGLVELVGELYDELKTRRERREAIGRALTIGGVAAIIGACCTYVKDHLK